MRQGSEEASRFIFPFPHLLKHAEAKLQIPKDYMQGSHSPGVISVHFVRAVVAGVVEGFPPPALAVFKVFTESVVLAEVTLVSELLLVEAVILVEETLVSGVLSAEAVGLLLAEAVVLAEVTLVSELLSTIGRWKEGRELLLMVGMGPLNVLCVVEVSEEVELVVEVSSEKL